jgi:hypothetical protein
MTYLIQFSTLSLNSANLFSFQKQCLIITIKSLHNLTLLALLPFAMKENRLVWFALVSLQLIFKDLDITAVFNACLCKHIISYVRCFNFTIREIPVCSSSSAIQCGTLPAFVHVSNYLQTSNRVSQMGNNPVGMSVHTWYSTNRVKRYIHACPMWYFNERFQFLSDGTQYMPLTTRPS